MTVGEEPKADNIAVASDSSFVRLVYPFLFERGRYSEVATRVDAATWTIKDQDRLVWGRSEVPSDELLPHVANYLNPGDNARSPDGGYLATGGLWSLCDTCRESLDGLAAGADWTLETPRGRPIPVRLRDVDLALFSLGVGFLSFRLEALSDRLDDWLDLQHHGRFMRGKRAPTLRCRRTVHGVATEPFVPAALRTGPQGGGAGRAGELGFTLGDAEAPLLSTIGLGPEGPSDVRAVFIRDRFLAYTVIFADVVGGDGRLSSREVRLSLFRLRRMFHSTQPALPAPVDLRGQAPHYLPYARRQWFWFTLEGGGFLAADAPRSHFFRGELPHHLDRQYFLLFLLALMQRFALIGLSDHVARHWNRVEGRARADSRREVFARIRESLFAFTARGYFAQVMQRENHHRCYTAWQRTFQLERLYEEVRAEVGEMSGHLHDRDLRSRDARIAVFSLLLTVLVGAPSLVIGFLNINLLGVTSGSDGLPLPAALGLVCGATLLVGLLFSCLWWVIRGRIR